MLSAAPGIDHRGQRDVERDRHAIQLLQRRREALLPVVDRVAGHLRLLGNLVHRSVAERIHPGVTEGTEKRALGALEIHVPKGIDTLRRVVYKHRMTSVPDLRDTWRIELREQGRTLAWLARTTGTPASTVYAYSMGKRRAPDGWLVKVADALGLTERAA